MLLTLLLLSKLLRRDTGRQVDLLLTRGRLPHLLSLLRGRHSGGKPLLTRLGMLHWRRDTRGEPLSLLWLLDKLLLLLWWRRLSHLLLLRRWNSGGKPLTLLLLRWRLLSHLLLLLRRRLLSDLLLLLWWWWW